MATVWDSFFEEKIRKIFTDKKYVVDIGGTLRIDETRNNRKEIRNDWIIPLTKEADYKVLDKVADFNPDIVGDIHSLPLADNSVDAIICIAVLEHVEDPKRAVEEVYRVLKPGGYAFFYAPFLFYYHPEKGYYGDFYRFTKEGFGYLTRQFSSVEMVPVRGPFATIANLVPFLSKRTGWLDWLDRMLRPHSDQVSGYNVFCVK